MPLTSPKLNRSHNLPVSSQKWIAAGVIIAVAFLSVVAITRAQFLQNRRGEFQPAPPSGDTMVTNGLIVRYWIDEAESGTTPTTLEDDGHGTDMDLTITYAGTMVWTNSSSSMRGLHCESASGDQRASYGALVAGDKLYDQLDNSITGTLEIVVSCNTFSSGGGRIFHLDDDTGGNGEFTMRCSSTSQPDNIQFFASLPNEKINGNIDAASAERIVWHWVFDTSLADNADRVKCYTNGVEVADADPAITQNEPLSFNVNETFYLLNRQSGSSYGRSMTGVLYYAAAYNIAFDSNQVTTNYNRLITDDDL